MEQIVRRRGECKSGNGCINPLVIMEHGNEKGCVIVGEHCLECFSFTWTIVEEIRPERIKK